MEIKKKAVGKKTFSVVSVEKEVEKERENIFKDVYEKCRQLIKGVIEKSEDKESK